MIPKIEKTFKLAFLYFSRLLGLFYLSRYVTRRALRILCYHGFSLADEHLFRPSLFVTPETFAGRLELLQKHLFPVIKLETAVARLATGDLPDCATVITIDDGFYSMYRIAPSLLKRVSFPATVYITTYYSGKETPVFRLVVQYMFWKTQRKVLDLSQLDSSLEGQFYLSESTEREKATWDVIRFGERAENETQRLYVEKRLGELLLVDFEEIWKTRILSLVTGQEIKALMADGIDIQLHTHRHRLPSDRLPMLNELADNRAVLEPIVGKELHHFCYPSGDWSPDHWPILAHAGMRSAVTCDTGLNYADTPVLALRRFLDGENVAKIELEAELVGYMELLRRLRNMVTGRGIGH